MSYGLVDALRAVERERDEARELLADVTVNGHRVVDVLHERDTLVAELAEAKSEIGRHHELIGWMRNQILWLLTSPNPVTPRNMMRMDDIETRINREVPA